MNFLSPPWNGNQLTNPANPTRWNHQSTATTEFIFVDGLDPCPPDPEVKSLWPRGPYLCYYTDPSHPTPEQWARGGKEEHDLAILQRYDPRTMSLRINIPILHVAGKRDPFYQQSDLLAGLCSANASSVIHDGGHFVPKYTHTTANIVRMIDALVGRVQHWC